MTWLTAALVAAYIGICEVRAPNAWTACESRWNWALGVLVPSPLPVMARLLPGRRKPRTDAPKEPQA